MKYHNDRIEVLDNVLIEYVKIKNLIQQGDIYEAISTFYDAEHLRGIGNVSITDIQEYSDYMDSLIKAKK